MAVFVWLKIPAHQPETLETPRQTEGGKRLREGSEEGGKGRGENDKATY